MMSTMCDIVIVNTGNDKMYYVLKDRDIDKFILSLNFNDRISDATIKNIEIIKGAVLL